MDNSKEWLESLSEQDIPAEVVDWSAIVDTGPPEAGAGGERRPDAGTTIGEPPGEPENRTGTDEEDR